MGGCCRTRLPELIVYIECRCKERRSRKTVIPPKILPWPGEPSVEGMQGYAVGGVDGEVSRRDMILQAGPGGCGNSGSRGENAGRAALNKDRHHHPFKSLRHKYVRTPRPRAGSLDVPVNIFGPFVKGRVVVLGCSREGALPRRPRVPRIPLEYCREASPSR